MGGDLVSDVQVVVYLLVGLMALAGAIGTAVLAARQKGTETLLAEQRAELTALREEVSENKARIKAIEGRERRLVNYVHRLRSHITLQLPPPPPEWPADLDV